MNPMMEALINKVRTGFEQQFATAAEYTVQAPGRVNIIGEHTDYNDGFVLPSAINFQTIVCANKRSDNVVRVVALDYDNGVDTFNLDESIEHSDLQWANYIRGVVKHLLASGYQFGGADIAVSGNVPQGAGLSSSASLEVVIGQTFKTLYQLDITQQQIALNGQAAENQFVGCNCGIMDQLISAEAKQGHASLIDCRSLAVKAVAFPENYSIVIVNSNKKRGLVDSEYNTRREQCEAAANYFNVSALRDVDIATFRDHENGLDPLIAKRARHVITENQRTLEAADALSSGDIQQLQALMAESHASMRDDFEITVFEIDLLVDLIKDVLGSEGGVRMTGGGFGGCVVAIVPDKLVSAVVDAVNQNYEKATQLTPSVFVCTAESGAGYIR